MSRAQTTRLVSMYLRGDPVQPKPYRRRRFPQRYTRQDAELLAAIDEAHDTLSGPATQKLLQRAHHNFHDARYERLAAVSVAQLYRLRKSHAYRHRLANRDDLLLSGTQNRLRGNGNKTRFLPMAPEAMQLLDRYLRLERPQTSSNALFVSLKGPALIVRYHRRTTV